MNLRRTLAMAKRVLKQLRHDRRTFGFIIAMPLIMIIVFGYTFGGEVSNVKVAVVNLDETASVTIPRDGSLVTIDVNIGKEIDGALDRDVLDIKRMGDLDKAKEEVRTSQFTDKTWAVIYIPKEFTATFTAFLQRTAVAKELNETACTSMGLFWYDDTCNAFADSPAADHLKEGTCEDAGFEWYNGRCHEAFSDKDHWTETECGAHGYFWYDGICHDGADLTIVVDASNPNVVAAVYQSVMEALQKAYNNIMDENPELRVLEMRNPINQVNDYAYGSGEIEFIDSFAPAIMAFAMMMVTTMITIFIFIGERKMGTLDRLLASPATETEIVVGYAAAFSLVSLLQALVILATSIGLFNIYIAEPVLLQVMTAFLFLILLGIGHQCLGIMLSSGAKNELQAIQFVPIIIFTSILLCGFLFPIESIPTLLRPLSYLIPLTYAIDAVRGTMLRGLGIDALCCQGVALIVFLIVMLAGAIMLLRKRK